MAFPTIDSRTCIVRDTAARKGRTQSVAPGTTARSYLHYGRIILDPGREGCGRHRHARDRTDLPEGRSDGQGRRAIGSRCGRTTALYVPRDARFEVTAGAAGCDLAEISAPVEGTYPVQFVSFAEVQKDPGLHFNAGGDASRRELNVLLGKNIEAGRIMAGVTFSQPGNWTSWPPHEHAMLAEEAYLYIDMPAPRSAFSWSTPTSANPSWRRSSAKATSC